MTARAVAIVALGACTFTIRALGPVLLGGRTMPLPMIRILAALPAAVFAALVVAQTVAPGGAAEVSARAAGVALAGVLAIRGRSMVLAVLAAAALAAGLRFII